ncbi:MAG TPA: ABC transporter substrate-binding protein [Ilumatobacter sp.]|nr:ABC transporter substrate-binding protein [Ilumatobacter sp.]
MKRTLGAAVMLVGLLGACGDDGDGATPPTSPAVETTAVPGSDSAAFPVTFTNALGVAELAAPPERVVAVGSAELDVLLALGVVPTTYVSYDDALLPYQQAAFAGAPAPELLSLIDGMPIEQIAATHPDLIVSLSWTDADNYPLLSQIAPVVAYVADPWGDAWQTQVIQIAGALGRADDGAALIAGVESQITAAATAHPELSGATATFTSVDDGALCSVDLPTSPVLVFLRQLGLQPTLDDASSPYCEEMSYELLDRIDTDVMLLFGNRDALEASSIYRQLPGVLDGNAVWLDDTMANAVNSPTPLAIPAFLDAVAPEMAAAAG